MRAILFFFFYSKRRDICWRTTVPIFNAVSQRDASLSVVLLTLDTGNGYVNY